MIVALWQSLSSSDGAFRTTPWRRFDACECKVPAFAAAYGGNLSLPGLLLTVVGMAKVQARPGR